MIKYTTQGEAAPRFYLPISRDWYTARTCHCFFVIAPVVLLFHILCNIFHSIWLDLFSFNKDLEQRNKK